MNQNNQHAENRQENHELPTIKVHGTKSLHQPSAETTPIPPKTFPIT